MAEYIDRDAVYTAFANACTDVLERASEIVYIAGYSYEYVIEILDDIPTADVAPVVHGQWILRHIGAGHYWECSVCHTNPCIYVTEHTKFCPNCGARMDEGED